MVHWMRKHKKWIITGLSIIVIPTFVYWGGSVGKARRNAAANGGGAGVRSVATVGGIPVTASEFQRKLSQEAQRRSARGGEAPTTKELGADGTAERILNSMIDERLLVLEVAKRSKTDSLDRAWLIEQLKKDPSFRDANGNLDAQAWNRWVSERSINWNDIYQNVQDSIARTVLLREVTAPVRVNDAEVKKAFEASHTTLQVKFVSVDAPVEPTDAQIQAQYDKDPTRYQIPEKRACQFVAVSLVPPIPTEAGEIVNKARAGEDFAELAKKFSKAADAKDGGAMDWREQTPDVPPALLPLFTTPVGGVTDPLELNGAYFIFKVEEEKTGEAGGRSVKGRQIMLRPELGEAERKAAEEKAAAIVAKAKTAGLEAAAAEAGLTVSTAPEVSKDSRMIDNVAMIDSFDFRQGVEKVAKDAISEPITARQHIYIAKVTEVTPPVAQALDAVRDRVRADAVQELRGAPEHAEATKALAKSVAGKAKSLQDIVTGFPELKAEIKETKEFTEKDYLFQDGMFVGAKAVIDAAQGKDLGAFFGPLDGFQGEAYFVELVKRTPPTDENWKTDWPKEEEQLRQQAMMQHRNALLMDYIASLREQAEKTGMIQRDNAVLAEILEPKEEPKPEHAADAAKPAPKKPAVPAPHSGGLDLGPGASE